ncbi:MAG: signal recognition particle-docking protein FtsY [Parasporobacterium sp.]|nr:signal recognition particle-docking protein FtsY [Parasporobacterium sp.]
MGFFSKLFKKGTPIDDDFYEEMEEQLILGDMGVQASMELTEALEVNVRFHEIKNQEEAREFLINRVEDMMKVPEDAYDFEEQTCVIMVIGVNGVGKTTSIGKLADAYKNRGKNVILVGADTFRAAAMDQLKIWAERTGCYMVSGNEGQDPGSVIYDGAAAARARGGEIMICDTAGRLHNKKNLMNELAKIDKILSSEFPDAIRENLIVLDAATGQNALQQAKEFKSIMKVDGIILTKMDGTAKGGIAVAISKELGVPVKFIGVGEGIHDLKRFDAAEYAKSLFN